MDNIPGLKTSLDYISRPIRQEIPEVFARAIRAGAEPPLDYVGAGMYGIVFCDDLGHAWKVMRLESGAERERAFQLENAAEEYEWLRDAAYTSIAGNVAQVYAIHPEEIVLERECVDGRPGVWADDQRLNSLHGKIEKVMLPLGWTAPEFKEDSYIIRPDKTPVLVDISMAQRVGMNLAGWIHDVLEGKRRTRWSWNDLAFYLLRERREKTIPEEIHQELIAELVRRDPGIAKQFSLKGPSLGARDAEEVDPFERYHTKDRRRRLIRHKYAKDSIDPKAIAACIYRPKSDTWSEHWYAITKGFPYDQGEWRVSVWDQRGPLSHYSDNLFRGPFKTLIEAVDDVLFEFRQARLVEYILPDGEHVRVGKGPSCF